MFHILFSRHKISGKRINYSIVLLILISLITLICAECTETAHAKSISENLNSVSLGYIPPRPTFTCEDTVRIMPLGDSITYDNFSGDPRPSSERTGYRSHLWWELEANGYNVDFVGNVVAGEAIVPAFDPDNEGHGGWRDDEIADNIYGWLESTPADVILLHIGTNGLDSSPDDVEDILDEVDRWESDNSQHITMIVARIINRASYSSTTTTFNDNVEAMALDRVNNASNDAYPDDIIMVDLEDGAGIDYSTDMVDNLHPTDGGYEKMALGTTAFPDENWYAKLTESVGGNPPLLPSCSEVTCPADMIAYWRLDETSSGTYADSYDSHPGTCSGSDCPTPDPGILNGGQLFSRLDATKIDVPAHSDFDWGADDSFTIEYWMRGVPGETCSGSVTSDNEVIVGRDDASSNLHIWTGCKAYDSGGVDGGYANWQLRDVNNNGVSITGTTNIADGSWHHVVAIRDASADMNYLYVDGIKEAEASHDYTAGFESATAALNLGWLNLPTYYHFTGAVDEVAVYGRALSASEITSHYNGGSGSPYCTMDAQAPVIASTPITTAEVGALYSYDVDASGYPVPSFSLSTSPSGMSIDPATGVISWTPGSTGDFDVTVAATNSEGMDTQSFEVFVTNPPICPVDMLAYLKLDELSGSTFDDYFNGHDASCSAGNCPSFATGILNGALDFNGTDQWITMPDDSELDWGADSSFSIEVWAKLTNCDSRNKVMVGRDNRPGGTHWWVGCSISTKTARFNLLDTNDNGIDVNGTTPINDGEWHHIVAVRDNSNDEIRLYVDGVLEDSATHDYTAGFDATTTLGIGYMAYTGTPDYFFDGLLDEVALYGRVLTPSEIIQHYNDGDGMPYCSISLQAPIITSTATIITQVGIPYSYDVEALGNPMPTFSLNIAPAGMTIDANSGLISWPSPTLGDHDVEVEAVNSEGSDTQAFVIAVTEAPPFVLRINSGGPTIVDGAVTWEGSAPYVSGGSDYTFSITSVDTTTNAITTPVPPFEVLQTCRHYDHTFDFSSVPDGNYIVRIIWTDQFDHDRIMEYRIEGETVLEDWNIVDAAGGTNIAVERFFNVSVSDGNGMQIEALKGAGNDVFEAAIEIVSLQSETPPIITSSAIVSAQVGIPYTYDVNASGHPSPTFSLTTAPVGMTIDPLSGLIEWTPISIGDFDVTVEAINSEGSDNQSFTIQVSSAPVCPLDMISYWKLDETTGSVFDDYYNGNSGSCPSGYCPTPTTGKVYGAQIFSRADQTAINVPADSDFDWGKDDSFTIEYWMKGIPGTTCSGSSTNDNEVIVGRDDAGSGLHIWTGCKAYDTGGVDGGYAAWQLRDINGNGDYIQGTTNIADGEWHHIVVIRDNSEDKNYLYVDGYKENELSFDYTAGFSSPTEPINIGWLNLSLGYYFTGTIDEVAVYSRVVEPSEILDHYNSGLGKSYCSVSPEPPTITSTPITVGEVGTLYTYDVDATGYPAPTYSLTESPSGMTIDPVSGLLEWTPSLATDEDVTVLATNSEGSDDQMFSILVSSPPICPLDLLSYWELDETSGSVFSDTADGNEAECSGENCPDFSIGKLEGGLDFNGTSDFLIVPDDPSLDWGAEDSFSIELWAQPDLCTTRNKVMIGRDDYISGSNHLHWWLGCKASGTPSERVATWNMLDSTHSGISLGGSTRLDDGSWHHLVVIRDESTNSNYLYVDGVLEASGTYDYLADFSGNTPLNIGYMAYNYTPDYFYDGKLDEIAIFDRALSAAEVAEHYNAGLGMKLCRENLEPTDFSLSNDEIFENESIGSIVGTLSTVDPDPVDMHIYTLVTGAGSDNNGSFTIIDDQLLTAEVFDYEAKDSFTVRIRSTDTGGLFIEKSFIISVVNVNEEPTDIALSNDHIPENQPAGVPIGTFSVVDQDVGDSHTCTLVAGAGSDDNASFILSDDQLLSAEFFDFENKDSYTIRVSCADFGGLYIEEIFTINITDVNETPTDIALSNDHISEKQPVGTLVGNFSSLDPDAGDTHTYSLVSGIGDADNGSFSISGDQLLTGEVFDHAGNDTYSIRIRSMDSGGLFIEEIFTITIVDESEPPTDIDLSNNEIAENEPLNTIIGSFSTTDPDIGDTFTYTLISGVGDDDNVSFVISGNQLLAAEIFDFDERETYSIRVRSTDSGGLFVEEQFTINILDLKDSDYQIFMPAFSN